MYISFDTNAPINDIKMHFKKNRRVANMSTPLGIKKRERGKVFLPWLVRLACDLLFWFHSSALCMQQSG